MKSISIRRSCGYGDVVSASCIASKISKLGFEVLFQSNKDCHDVLRRTPCISGYSEPSGDVDINLDGAYENHPDKKRFHFSEMFTQRANEFLKTIGAEIESSPWNATLEVSEEEKFVSRLFMAGYAGRDKPWVVICPRSNGFVNRTIPDTVWSDVAKNIYGSCFWLGSHSAAPHNIHDLKCRTIDSVILAVSVADVLVTVDTGVMHIGDALGIRMVAIEQSSSPKLHLSEKANFTVVSPELDCLNCQLGICPINPAEPPCMSVSPEAISDAVNRKLVQ